MPVSPITPSPSREPVRVRPMLEADLDEADRIVRLAFGTFLGLPDPTLYMGDANYVRPRWLTNPAGALVAEEGDEIVGSAFVANWGTVGFFGPLTVRPDRWDRGVAKALLVAVEDRFAEQGTRLCGLNTFPGSPKHLGLYQKFGYLPGALVATLARPIPPDARGPSASWFSQERKHGAEALLMECREMTDAVYEGLDLRDEIRSVAGHDFGDTVLLRDGRPPGGPGRLPYRAGHRGGRRVLLREVRRRQAGPGSGAVLRGLDRRLRGPRRGPGSPPARSGRERGPARGLLRLAPRRVPHGAHGRLHGRGPMSSDTTARTTTSWMIGNDFKGGMRLDWALIVERGPEGRWSTSSFARGLVHSEAMALPAILERREVHMGRFIMRLGPTPVGGVRPPRLCRAAPAHPEGGPPREPRQSVPPHFPRRDAPVLHRPLQGGRPERLGQDRGQGRRPDGDQGHPPGNPEQLLGGGRQTHALHPGRGRR